MLVRIPWASKGYQASIQCLTIIGSPAKQHLNGVLLVGRWWVVFGSSLPSSTKKLKKCCQSWTPSDKISGSAHEPACTWKMPTFWTENSKLSLRLWRISRAFAARIYDTWKHQNRTYWHICFSLHCANYVVSATLQQIWWQLKYHCLDPDQPQQNVWPELDLIQLQQSRSDKVTFKKEMLDQLRYSVCIIGVWWVQKISKASLIWYNLYLKYLTIILSIFYKLHVKNVSMQEGKDQESIQSSTTPDPGHPGHHMGKWQYTIKHHIQENQEVSSFVTDAFKGITNTRQKKT